MSGRHVIILDNHPKDIVGQVLPFFEAAEQPYVIFGIGIPGSGKTTILRLLAQRLSLAIVCPDDIRHELTGDANDQSLDSEVWLLARQRVAEQLKLGKSVIFDATFARKKWRRQETTAVHAMDAQTIGWYMNTPLVAAWERNQSRDRFVPHHVLESMHHSLQTDPPTIEDGFDQVFEIRTGN